MGGGGGVLWTGGMPEQHNYDNQLLQQRRLEQACMIEQDTLTDEQLISIIREHVQVFVVATMDNSGQASAETIVCRRAVIHEISWEAALESLRNRLSQGSENQTVD